MMNKQGTLRKFLTVEVILLVITVAVGLIAIPYSILREGLSPTEQAVLAVLILLATAQLADNYSSMKQEEKSDAHYKSQQDIGQIVKNFSIDTTNKDILELVKDIQRKHLPTNLYTNRADHILAFTEALKEAPEGSHVYVTHFEKYRGASNDKHEVEAERRFMELWTDKVLKGSIHVRDIIHVCSTADLDEVEERIKLFEKSPNYLLNVMYGPRIKPHIDCVIIRGQWAMFDLPDNPTSPFEDATAIAYTDPDIIGALERYFDIWWSKFSISVKDNHGHEANTLLQFRDLLPSRENESLWEKSNELSLHLANERQLYHDVLDIAEGFASLKKVPVADVLKEKASKHVRDCKENIQHLSRDVVQLEPEESVRVLLSIFKNATVSVNAVSYDPDRQEDFWESPEGDKVLRASADARKRGVKVTRIFILTPDQVNNPRVMAILNQQREAKLEVLVAEAQSLPPELLKDHGIMDDNLIFEMDVIHKKEGFPTGNGYASIGKEEIKKKKRLFDMLSFRSRNLDRFFSDLKTEANK